MLPPHALPAGRPARLGATRGFHHGLIGPTCSLLTPCQPGAPPVSVRRGVYHGLLDWRSARSTPGNSASDDPPGRPRRCAGPAGGCGAGRRAGPVRRWGREAGRDRFDPVREDCRRIWRAARPSRRFAGIFSAICGTASRRRAIWCCTGRAATARPPCSSGCGRKQPPRTPASRSFRSRRPAFPPRPDWSNASRPPPGGGVSRRDRSPCAGSRGGRDGTASRRWTRRSVRARERGRCSC